MRKIVYNNIKLELTFRKKGGKHEEKEKFIP